MSPPKRLRCVDGRLVAARRAGGQRPFVIHLVPSGTKGGHLRIPVTRLLSDSPARMDLRRRVLDGKTQHYGGPWGIELGCWNVVAGTSLGVPPYGSSKGRKCYIYTN